MDQSANTRTVQEMFAAFQRDVEGVLGLLAEDVECAVPGPPEVPSVGTYRGREGAARFLAALDAAVDYERWEPQQFVAQGDTVVVVGEERWRAKRTGRVVDDPWVMVFTLRDGKDTAAVAAAFRSG